MKASPAEELQRLERSSRYATSSFATEGRLIWHIWGTGSPLVLLHGGYGSWRHWARNIDALSRQYELWVPDLPGLGESTLPPPDMGPEEIAGVVIGGLHELGVAPLAGLAGFSFGAIIAGHMASQMSVPSLVLIGASGLGVARADVPLEKVAPGSSETERASAHRRNLASLMIADPLQVDELAVVIQMTNVQMARFKSFRISRADALLTALRRTRADRISAVWGQHDAVAEETMSERISLLETLPQFRCYDVIERAGHWVMYEAPAQFNGALERQIQG